MAVQPKQSNPLCVVRIGYHVTLLMPADLGMKLVSQLQKSVIVKDTFERGSAGRYEMEDVPEVVYETVKASEVTPKRSSVPEQGLAPQRRLNSSPKLIGGR